MIFQVRLESVGDLSNPFQVVGHLDVDAGHALLSAADAPTHHAYHLPGAGALAHHGSTAVTLETKQRRHVSTK